MNRFGEDFRNLAAKLGKGLDGALGMVSSRRAAGRPSSFTLHFAFCILHSAFCIFFPMEAITGAFVTATGHFDGRPFVLQSNIFVRCL